MLYKCDGKQPVVGKHSYIFEGYVSHQHEMIMLAGFPDIPLSKPHSQESEERMGI